MKETGERKYEFSHLFMHFAILERGIHDTRMLISINHYKLFDMSLVIPIAVEFYYYTNVNAAI